MVSAVLFGWLLWQGYPPESKERSNDNVLWNCAAKICADCGLGSATGMAKNIQLANYSVVPRFFSLKEFYIRWCDINEVVISINRTTRTSITVIMTQNLR